LLLKWPTIIAVQFLDGIGTFTPNILNVRNIGYIHFFKFYSVHIVLLTKKKTIPWGTYMYFSVLEMNPEECERKLA
jgi:hypothetical protein